MAAKKKYRIQISKPAIADPHVLFEMTFQGGEGYELPSDLPIQTFNVNVKVTDTRLNWDFFSINNFGSGETPAIDTNVVSYIKQFDESELDYDASEGWEFIFTVNVNATTGTGSREKEVDLFFGDNSTPNVFTNYVTALDGDGDPDSYQNILW